MDIILGKTEVSLLNPPNEGTVKDEDGTVWRICRTGNGNIVLRNKDNTQSLLAEAGGYSMEAFCCWINRYL